MSYDIVLCTHAKADDVARNCYWHRVKQTSRGSLSSAGSSVRDSLSSAGSSMRKLVRQKSCMQDGMEGGHASNAIGGGNASNRGM